MLVHGIPEHEVELLVANAQDEVTNLRKHQYVKASSFKISRNFLMAWIFSVVCLLRGEEVLTRILVHLSVVSILRRLD